MSNPLAKGRESIIVAHDKDVIIRTHNNDVLLYGDRLRLLRESKNVTQQELALTLGVGIDEAKQVERGMTMCSAERIAIIRNALDAEFLPLTDDEIPAFRERLYIWRDMIRNRKIDEATELQGKIAGIVDLDVDFGLISLYRMFEITLLIVQGDFGEATMKLDSIDKASIDTESQYYYFRNKGTINILADKYEDALMYFSQALEIGKSDERILKDDDSIYFNIALCYHNLHLPNHAIKFLEDSDKERTDRTTTFGWHIDSILAVNYIRIRQLSKSEVLLQKCLTYAEASGDKFLIAIALHNYGFMHHTAENWLLAISYYSRASEFYVQGSATHLANLYQLCRCHIEVGEFTKSAQLLSSVEEYLVPERNSCLPEDKFSLYQLFFKSLHSLILIIRKDVDLDKVCRAVEYIEKTAIVYLSSVYEYTCVLDYCEVLVEFFTEAQEYEKTIAIKDIAMDLYRKMLYYGRN